MEFLISHHFPMGVPFRDGVPYLSRQEEARARQNELERHDKSKLVDIIIKENDLESLKFAARVRSEILKWKHRTTVCFPSLNRSNPNQQLTVSSRIQIIFISHLKDTNLPHILKEDLMAFKSD